MIYIIYLGISLSVFWHASVLWRIGKVGWRTWYRHECGYTTRFKRSDLDPCKGCGEKGGRIEPVIRRATWFFSFEEKPQQDTR